MARPKKLQPPEEAPPGSDSARIHEARERFKTVHQLPSHLVSPPPADANGVSTNIQAHMHPMVRVMIEELLRKRNCPWRNIAEVVRCALAVFLDRLAHEDAELAPTEISVLCELSEYQLREQTMMLARDTTDRMADMVTRYLTMGNIPAARKLFASCVVSVLRQPGRATRAFTLEAYKARVEPSLHLSRMGLVEWFKVVRQYSDLDDAPIEDFPLPEEPGK
jgi:hypothetical protein